MKRLLGSVIGGCFLVAAGAAVAAPPGHGQHFDCSDGGSGVSCASDDTGCVPQSKDDPSGGVAATLKCGDGLSKAFGAAIRSVIKCHIKLADSDFGAKDFDENVCEENDPAKGKAALQKYNAAMTKLTTKAICTQSCLSASNRTALGANVLAQVEAGNQLVYPCPSGTTTTTTTSSTTSTSIGGCSCAGGTPTKTIFTTGIGSGTCGHLDADGNPNFFTLACGGLYFGGAGVGVPLPSK